MIPYNFQQLKQEGKITDQQFALLSWLAWSSMMYDAHKEAKYYNFSMAYDNSCTTIGIPESMVLAVKMGNIKGLQNYNRLSYTAYFDKNIMSYAHHQN
jgi:hypothetical protein